MIIVGAGGYFGYHLAKKNKDAICIDTDYSVHSISLMKTNVIIKRKFEEVDIKPTDIIVAPILDNTYKANKLTTTRYVEEKFAYIEKVIRLSKRPVLLSSHRAEGDNMYGWWLRTFENFAQHIINIWNKDLLIIRLHNFYGDDEWERNGYISVMQKIYNYRNMYRSFPVYTQNEEVGSRYFMDIEDAVKLTNELIHDNIRGIVEIHGEELVEIDALAESKGLQVRYVEDKVWKRLLKPKIKYKEFIV